MHDSRLLRFAFLAVAAVAAVSAASPETAVNFTCTNGKSLKVVFSGNQAKVTPKAGKTITLPQSLAADGFLYSTSKYSLRGKGNSVAWTVAGAKPLICETKG